MTVAKQDGLHTDVAESAVDLRGKEDRFCSRDANGKLVVTGNGGYADGIISEGKPAGKHTSFNTDGNPILRIICAGNVAQNQRVQSDANGAAVAGLNNSFGKAREPGVAGQVIAIIPNRFDADGA